MLTAFDDYLIHQTPEPVAHPGPRARARGARRSPGGVETGVSGAPRPPRGLALGGGRPPAGGARRALAPLRALGGRDRSGGGRPVGGPGGGAPGLPPQFFWLWA